MGKGNEKVYMKLDVFKKASKYSAAKSRTLSMVSKIGIGYRFKKITNGLLVLLFLAYLFYRGMHKDPNLDLTVVIIFYALLLAVSFMFLFAGIRRLLNTISLIEYGTVTSATVSSLKEWRTRRSIWSGMGTSGSFVVYTKHKNGCITCGFTDSSGKPHSVEFFFRNDEDQIKKGDSFAVIYDPETPGNALVVSALPRFVKTDPALLEKGGE